jgi:hypothetical protein
MILVGSPTQSRVIDDFTPGSALTFAGQPCMKGYIENSEIIKIKSVIFHHKINRKTTTTRGEDNARRIS